MNGQDIFKQAVNKLSESTSKALDECDLSVKDIDWFIPHQANQRIISSTAKKLGISEEKIISTVKFHAKPLQIYPISLILRYKRWKN